MYKHILVAINETAAAKRALAEAVKLAGTQQAQLRLVYVVDQSISNVGEHGWVSSGNTRQALDQAEATAVRILEEATQYCQAAGLAAQTAMPKTVSTSIVTKILEEAEHWPADLIVMGTHGREGVQRLLMGSVAAGVVHAAHIPVMLIRAS